MTLRCHVAEYMDMLAKMRLRAGKGRIVINFFIVV